jgi:sarcosine oxidase subunit gamma
MAEGHRKTLHCSTGDEIIICCAPSKAKLVLRAHPSALELIGRTLAMNFVGVSGHYVEREDDRALWLGPDEWLLKSSNEPAGLINTLERDCAGLRYAVVDVSSMYMTVHVCGQRSAFLINHGCPLDLSAEAFENGRCTRTVLGKSEIILSRLGERAFEIDVLRSFTPYVVHFLREASIGLNASSKIGSGKDGVQDGALATHAADQQIS